MNLKRYNLTKNLNFNQDDRSITIPIFRIILGLFLIILTVQYINIDLAFYGLNGPELRFKYHFLEWAPDFSLTTNRILLWLMLLASFLVMIGFLYRISIITFTFIFAHFFLADETLYNNHLYLILLLGIILSFIPANFRLSLDHLIFKRSINSLKKWHLFMLKLQLFVVYFFGGINKIQVDWLNGNLAEILISNSNQVIFEQDMSIQFFIWGGILLDLFIAFGFLYRKTFWPALLAAFIFHLHNALMFDDIGIFPYMMFLLSIIFIPTKLEEKLRLTFGLKALKPSTQKDLSIFKMTLISCFILLQFLIPIRHHFLTKNPEWSGIAQKFSWRMKLMSKTPENVQFILKNLETNTLHPLEYDSYISSNQKQHFFDDPSYMIQFAKYVKEDLKAKGIVQSRIYFNGRISSNGNPAKEIIESTMDLSSLNAQYFSDPPWMKF